MNHAWNRTSTTIRDAFGETSQKKKKQHGKYRMNSKNIRSINSSVIARLCVTYAMRTEFLFTQHNVALMLIINFIFVSRSSCETNQMLEKMIFSSYIIYNEQFFPFFFDKNSVTITNATTTSIDVHRWCSFKLSMIVFPRNDITIVYRHIECFVWLIRIYWLTTV